MSLTFDLREVPEDVRLVTATVDEPINGIKAGDRIMAPVTNYLIWGSMATGIGVINDETAPEIHARLALLATLDLYPFHSWDAETESWVKRSVTLEEVESHKGLSTNVFPQESRAKWVKRWVTDGREIFPQPEPKRSR